MQGTDSMYINHLVCATYLKNPKTSDNLLKHGKQIFNQYMCIVSQYYSRNMGSAPDMLG